MTTKDLQERQAEYDANYWEHHDQFEKVRHILLHLNKLTGKVATYCEAVEHGKESSTEQIEREVVPDLEVYALQLANLFGIDLEGAYLARLENNVQRLHGGG